MECAFQGCKQKIRELSARVEVKTVLPKSVTKSVRSKLCVLWKPSGDAVFHTDCWKLVLKSARSRSKKSDLPQMTTEEKVLVKEAAKTAEFFDSLDHIKSEAKRVAKMIMNAEHCVAFTGAGISTAAGIGDYRGKSGKWTEMDQTAIDMDAMFTTDNPPPSKKRKTESQNESISGDSVDACDDQEEDGVDNGVPYESLRPTYTHEALVKLLDLGYLKYVISQNGDGLHGLSGISCDKMSELHGNVFVEKCEKCGKRYERSYYVMDDVGNQHFEDLEDCGTSDVKKPKHAVQCQMCGLSHRTGRRCEKEKCKGYLMDTIINFRDNLEDQAFDRAMDNATDCDLMLCLGSTLTVTPASYLAESMKEPLRLVICNRQPTHLDKECSTTDSRRKPLGSRVFGDCDVFFREIMAEILPKSDLDSWESGRSWRLVQYDTMRVKPKE